MRAGVALATSINRSKDAQAIFMDWERVAGQRLVELRQKTAREKCRRGQINSEALGTHELKGGETNCPAILLIFISARGNYFLPQLMRALCKPGLPRCQDKSAHY